MKIADLIHDLPCELVRGSPQAVVRDVTDDSRRAGPGSLFVARPGTATDGARYIDAALDAGAVAVLTAAPDPGARRPDAAVLRADDVAAVGARLAERILGDPSRALRLVGITGTNGKTTTAHLAHQLLAADGGRCGLVGTVHTDDGRDRRTSTLTTPGSADLSATLRRMVDHGCDACVMEVSSHALGQRRTDGLRFDVAVFTNLSGDHLDYHGTMDAYRRAKRRLFEAIETDGWGVVNVDDPAGPHMAAACAGRVRTTSLADRGADCHAELRSAGIDGLRARLRGPWGDLDVRLPLVGRHNASNALQAAAVADALGVPGAVIRAALETATAPPGRLEPVTDAAHGFAVLVDYAHTDDALVNVLAALSPLVPDGGRLRVVFGCGGDRDRTKRPRMARAAWRFADEVIVTSDNPRTEDPDAIVDEIMTGVPAGRADRTTRIVDRAEAIRAAVRRAAPGDVVLIAGKGHEDYQIVGTDRRPFDDRVVAAEALADGAAGR
ncbi:MAG: UDP-N-acetylmuramoyl-L-alanyl-D-glutamate--2,6-diaminopimelate ligase [Planctomycetota bacterium]|jgi:UDP-N-acetylmuramoyl-L-alanyl-D-glutamate--2,6-diaminopimelate ligase